MEASFFIGRVASQTSLFTSAANTLRASPSLICFAISSAEEPCSYCLTAPSGKVIFIIDRFILNKNSNSKDGKFNEVLGKERIGLNDYVFNSHYFCVKA